MAALSSIRIVTNYDNEPYVRSLTATLQWNPDEANTWVTFSTASNTTLQYFNIYWKAVPGEVVAPIETAYSIKLNMYIDLDDTFAPDDANPIIINFSAYSYDPQINPYRLFNLNLSAGVGIWPLSWPAGGNIYPLDTNTYAVVTTPPIVYDTFPYANGELFINYESSNKNNTFYRLTSSTPYTTNINVTSKQFPINTSLNGSYYTTNLLLNSNQTLSSLNQVTSFNCFSPTVCSLQATVSAISAVGALSGFYSPHKFILNSISAIFVSSLPAANFIAYPSQYFTNAISPPTQLNASNYTLTPGVCFYGEGHTESINLSASSVTGITNYIWRDINNYLFVVSAPLTSNTNSLNVATNVGNYPTIPIGLQITTTSIPSTAPIIKYSDIDGTPSYYPYFNSTVDINGNESSTNNKLHQSIKVVPYDDVTFTFNAGYTDPTITLPADGSQKQFTASLNVGFNGAAAVQPCYDKYGIDWQWATFENCSAQQTTFALPSSWTTTSSAGAFPKKWYNECNTQYSNCSAGIVAVSPVGCTGSTTTWSLSTDNWYTPPYTVSSNNFTYTLNFVTPFVPPYTNFNKGYISGIFPADKISTGHITATETVSCKINAAPGDWLTKITLISATSAFKIQGAPILRLYTPNRYVLTGTNVVYENIIVNPGLLKNLTINYGNNNVVTVTGTSIAKNFSSSYNTIGPKSITLSSDLIYGGTHTKTFPNIITVVNQYDEIIPGSYITTHTPLIPPYTTAPLIAPNDNAVADNINSVITKIYDNLNYLQQRSKVYPNTTLDNFGWLGISDTTVPDITGYKWIEFLNTDVTWLSLSCDLTTGDKIVIKTPA
jgi:hypothetical protein